MGYGSALSSLIYLGSFAGVALLSRCLPDAYIILLGLTSVAAGLIMAAFAKSTLLMLLGKTEFGHLWSFRAAGWCIFRWNYSLCFIQFSEVAFAAVHHANTCPTIHDVQNGVWI